MLKGTNMVETKLAPKNHQDTARPELDHEERLDKNRDNEQRGGASLPNAPPVIETFYPSINGLPAGVFEEWVGECFSRTRKERPRGARG